MMTSISPQNPNHEFDEILEKRKKGSLKIYLGYAAGVGKTYSMLQEGNRLRERGFDVVIGYVEPHDRPETWEQIRKLEMLPRKKFSVGNQEFEEMDLDAVIARKPQIVLVDELAHTNATGSKNLKRYQDVLEILEHQINVITTLNVQHLESIAETVSEVTGVEVRERVPDIFVHQSDQIVTIDVTIDELRERLRLGKIYKKDQAEKALQKFFTPKNLSILREMTLKEALGDQWRKNEFQELMTESASSLTHGTVMVAISANPQNASTVIKKGAKLASQLASPCLVVYVQKPDKDPIMQKPELQKELEENFKLAQTLDAEVKILKGDNISNTLVHFAHENNVKHAVFGKSRLSPLIERIKGSVILDFIHDSVGIDVHIATITGGDE